MARTTARRTLMALAALALTAACRPAPAPQADAAAIAELMHATWDRPDAPLDPSPIVISGDYAIADWTQGDVGGRALLQRGENGWRVVLCGGDALRTTDGIASTGVPIADATALARAIMRAEQDVGAERLQAMSRFEGIVRMEP